MIGMLSMRPGNLTKRAMCPRRAGPELTRGSPQRAGSSCTLYIYFHGRGPGPRINPGRADFRPLPLPSCFCGSFGGSERPGCCLLQHILSVNTVPMMFKKNMYTCMYLVKLLLHTIKLIVYGLQFLLELGKGYSRSKGTNRHGFTTGSDGCLQVIYRNCTGIVQELYRNCTGIVQELYRIDTQAFKARCRFYASCDQVGASRLAVVPGNGPVPRTGAATGIDVNSDYGKWLRMRGRVWR